MRTGPTCDLKVLQEEYGGVPLFTQSAGLSATAAGCSAWNGSGTEEALTGVLLNESTLVSVDNTALNSVVARVLESFTDQDRLEYAEKLYTVNLRANLLHDTNGKTGAGCTPFRGTRSYALQHLLHSSRDRDPGDGSRLSGRGGEPPDELVFPDSALPSLRPIIMNTKAQNLMNTTRRSQQLLRGRA